MSCLSKISAHATVDKAQSSLSTVFNGRLLNKHPIWIAMGTTTFRCLSFTWTDLQTTSQLNSVKEATFSGFSCFHVDNVCDICSYLHKQTRAHHYLNWAVAPKMWFSVKCQRTRHIIDDGKRFFLRTHLWGIDPIDVLQVYFFLVVLFFVVVGCLID